MKDDDLTRVTKNNEHEANREFTYFIKISKRKLRSKQLLDLSKKGLDRATRNTDLRLSIVF
jgi:hypothetical protein